MIPNNNAESSELILYFLFPLFFKLRMQK